METSSDGARQHRIIGSLIQCKLEWQRIKLSNFTVHSQVLMWKGRKWTLKSIHTDTRSQPQPRVRSTNGQCRLLISKKMLSSTTRNNMWQHARCLGKWKRGLTAAHSGDPLGAIQERWHFDAAWSFKRNWLSLASSHDRGSINRRSLVFLSIYVFRMYSTYVFCLLHTLLTTPKELAQHINIISPAAGSCQEKRCGHVKLRIRKELTTL